MYGGAGGGDVCTVVWVVVRMCGWWWCLYGGVGGGVCTVVWVVVCVGCVGGECG